MLASPQRLRANWFSLLLSALASSCLQAPSQEQGAIVEVVNLDLVPLPSVLELNPGSGFVLGRSTCITWDEDARGMARSEASRMRDYIESGTGWQLKRAGTTRAEGELRFALDTGLSKRLGAEGYRIEVSPERLLIRAANADGLFYGAQTLRQMMSPKFSSSAHEPDFGGSVFAPMTIEDAPRFGWRGMHLDVGRHLYPVEDIKRFLDGMAFYKFNVFHWHLTEDQGWRIEIKKFPRLTSVGGFRKSSPLSGDRNQSDGVPYGGFYTQDEIREVVAYAAALKIDVMPEIELPGHSLAAISAYPELGNPEFAEGLEVGTRWGVYPNILNPNESTLRFYEQVFDEVMELFPFQFIHIGGDEAPKTQWENSPSAQARMHELGIEDEHALQAWFVAHFERYLASHDRRLVGWDEIQEGGLPSGATMMVWRGWNYGIEAARKGHDVIMAPSSHTYFDYYQADPTHEPEAIGGLLTLERVYSFEPLPEALSPKEAEHILGAQGQLWSEYFPNMEHVEYMAFPRMIALSEVLWSAAAARDWSRFQERLSAQLPHLDALGIHYRLPVPTPDVDVVFFTDHAWFEQPKLLGSNAGTQGCSLVYSVDGSEPSAASPKLAHRLRLSASTTIRVARLNANGRVSHASSMRYEKLDAHPDVPNPSGLEPGLWRQDFFGVQANRIPDFALLLSGASAAGDWQIRKPRPVQTIALDDLVGEDRFASRFSGWIELSQSGIYTFRLGSDDGSRLEIAGIPVVDLDGPHGHIQRSGRIQLPAGLWPIEVGYFEAGGAESLEFAVEGPGNWRFLRERSQ